MKRIISIYCFVLLIQLLLTGCASSGDEFPADSEKEAQEILVNFIADHRVDTRTSLVGSDPVQHVTYVQLYVFKHMGQDDAVCIASKNVQWEQNVGSTAAQAYNFDADLQSNATYTFLAVGLDEAAKSGGKGSDLTYGLPEAITLGTLLSQASAVLASGRTTEDIAQSELFAGSATFTFSQGSNKIVNISLSRRVAGLMLYIKNLPSNTERVDVTLYQEQNTAVTLIPKNGGEDYGWKADGSLSGSTLLSIPSANISHGQAEKGVYLLPVAVPSSVATLRLKVYDTEGQCIYDKAIHDNRYISFPLLANHFYRIGTKDEPVDFNDPKPVQLIVDASWEDIYDITGK